jgi:hypothetical protein
MMKQISVYFKSDTYLQTESYIRLYANAKTFISIYLNYIQFSVFFVIIITIYLSWSWATF